MNRAAVGTLMLLSGLLAGCSVSSQGEFESIALVDIPFGLANPSTITPTTTTSLPDPQTVSGVVEQPVDLFFVSSSSLIRVQRNIVSPATVSQVLALLAEGPASDSTFAGLRSALPTTFRADVKVTRGVAEVDATRTFLTALQAADQRLAIAQLVLTLTSRPGVGQVIFTVESIPIAVPRGRGDLVPPGTPVTFDDYANLIGSGQ